jgi:hypothetical protein
MKKIVFVFLILTSFSAFSSNLIGGEITCRNISGLMYETTLTIFRDGSLLNLPTSLTITYRDSLDTIVATHIINTPIGLLGPNGVKSYKYIDSITFISNGTYKVSSRDSYRDTALNIANATNYGLYLECMILADGSNSSPQFLAAPISVAQLNQPFTNNLTPYDVDRDSLSWELVIPEDLVNNGSGGFNIVTLPYNYPPSDTSLPFHLDSILGDISFKPNVAGKYQIAVKLIEWRNGIQIGFVKRDVSINVIQSSNAAVHVQGLFTIYPNLIHINWAKGTPTPTIYLQIPQDFLFHLEAWDSTSVLGPLVYEYTFVFPNITPNFTGATWPHFFDEFFSYYPTISDISSVPKFITFRVDDPFSLNVKFFTDYTFRIFVSNTTTSINEISNGTKSFYLKSIDLLGRETDPNLPGFRIDLYSDGKTKKVFRGE